MKILLTSIITFLSVSAFAQLRPVKDPESCSYGLKDQNGKWIVQPYYTDIRLRENYFAVTDINYEGILSLTGAVIVPAVYDYVYPQPSGLFLVKKNELTGVCNETGKLLFPLKYASVTDSYGRLYLTRQENGAMYTTVAEYSGTVMIPEIKGCIVPFGHNLYTPIGDGVYNNLAWGNAGLIDQKGEIVRERTFSSIEACGEYFIVFTEKGNGFVSMDNKMFFEPDYHIYNMDPYADSRNCIQQGSFYQMWDGKKSGVMNGRMKIVLEPEYDQVEKLPYGSTTDSAAFMVQLGGKWGVFSPSGKQCIPVIYDTIIARSPRNYSGAISPAAQNGLFFCKQNGATVLLNDRGERIVPGSFTSYERSYNGNAWMFYNGSELTIFHWLKPDNNIVVAKEVTVVDSLKIYKSGDELYAMIRRNTGGKVNWVLCEEGFMKSGNYRFLSLYRRDSYGYAVYMFDLQGKLKDLKGIAETNFINNSRAILRFRNGSHQLLNTITGALLLTGDFEDINGSMIQSNLVFARKRVKPAGNSFNYQPEPFFALDSNGRRIGNASFDNIIARRDIQVVYNNQLAGVIDGNFNWIIRPAYKKLQLLNKDRIAVNTVSGKYGVIDHSNKLIVDTVWTKLTEVYKGYLNNNFSYRDFADENALLLEKPGEIMLYNTNGQVIRAKSKEDPDYGKIKEQLVNYTFIKDSNFANGFRITVPDRPLNFSKSLFAYPVYDSLIGLTGEVFPNFVNAGSLYHRGTGTVEAFGEKFCSFGWIEPPKIMYDNDWKTLRNSETTPGEQFWNLILVNGKIQEVKLNDLFSSEEQRNRMIREAMKRTLREDQCLSPTLPEIQRFSLRGNGVRIVMYDYSEVFLTTEDLQKESTNWILNYLR